MSRAAALLMLLLALPSCATPWAGRDGVGIDHIIVGVADLDRAIDEVERRTGVRPINGGAHPGGGTRNALLSLGPDTYLELLAPNPREPVDSPDVRELAELAAPTPVGWAVHTSDPAMLRGRLESAGLVLGPLTPGSRARPDGAVLHWSTFEIAAPTHPLAPFFIRWTDPAAHPARTSPAGCTLRSLELQDPDPATLERVLAPLAVGVRVVRASNRRMKLALSCPRGLVEF